MKTRSLELAGGLLALAFVLLNVAWHVQHGRWFESFWLCNVSLSIAAIGFVARSSLLLTIAFAWLFPGTLAWASEALFFQSSFAPTSYLVHVGGSVLAALGVARFGAHRLGQPGALLTLAGLLALSRLLPSGANVNCAFGPRDGWSLLPEHGFSYAAVTMALAIAASTLSMAAARRVASFRPPTAYRLATTDVPQGAGR